jgi:osmotically-inducible protein OsmY
MSKVSEAFEALLFRFVLTIGILFLDIPFAGDDIVMKKIAVFLALSAATILATGCSTTDNTNVANNSNVARVVNNNGNANTIGVTTTNANTVNENRRANANITREEYERDKERYQREARESGSTVGSGLEDGWLWTKTRAALATTDDLRDSTINVDVQNSVVALRGTVASAAQKAKAETVAKGIEGVKSVRNELKVAPAGTNTNANNRNAAANANRRG